MNSKEQTANWSSNFSVPSCSSRQVFQSARNSLRMGSGGTLKPTKRTGVSAAVFSRENLVRYRLGAESNFHSWEVLLVTRRNEPYRGCWSLPGGNLLEDEDILDGAKRELREETGVILPSLQGPLASQDVNELFTIYVCAGVCESNPVLTANDDAERALFVPLNRMSQLDTTPGLAEIVHRVAALVLPASCG
jgi:ADP-ribose pyrophosphatase YjhB (NUDIX family)